MPAEEAAEDQLRVFASDSVQAPHVRTASGRVLLADDNADMRDYVRRLLRDRYEVEVVENGSLALARVQERAPDLVLTDVMMPEMDGFALLRSLRENPENRDGSGHPAVGACRGRGAHRRARGRSGRLHRQAFHSQGTAGESRRASHHEPAEAGGRRA